MIARRAALRLIGLAPALARAVANEAGGLATGINLGGNVGTPQPALSTNGVNERDQWKAALKIPGLRDDLVSALYERYRHVGYIDHDIASMRSFSLAAKVTFQRQRNVARELYDNTNEGYWDRTRRIIRRAVGLPF
jgi:hypothetical protein